MHACIFEHLLDLCSTVRIPFSQRQCPHCPHCPCHTFTMLGATSGNLLSLSIPSIRSTSTLVCATITSNAPACIWHAHSCALWTGVVYIYLIQILQEGMLVEYFGNMLGSPSYSLFLWAYIVFISAAITLLSLFSLLPQPVSFLYAYILFISTPITLLSSFSLLPQPVSFLYAVHRILCPQNCHPCTQL